MPTWRPPDLSRRVTLVRGASRGVGRGIAKVLGECGATVYVTGRSSGRHRTEGLAQTVEETAALVTAAGGQGVPVVCDHNHDDEVERLFSRIGTERGALDLLVNNVWGGYEGYAVAPFEAPFWQQPVWRLDGMFSAGLRAHYVATRLAAPLMLDRPRGLVISTSAGDGEKYRGQVAYDTIKHAQARMAWGMARELRPHGVAALCLQPGFTRTERVVAALGQAVPDSTHSTEYVGRAVAALAADPNALSMTGMTLRVADVAKRYGFTDVDGRQVPPFRLPDSYA
ncbi:MAG: SDR family NAD(P)-dependent oxidoreductase [Thermoplasmatota archaeon]